MAQESKPKSGGGAATTAGTTFQEDVACYFATLILAEANAEPALALPATTRLLDIVAESAQPVDDLIIRTSEGGVVLVQTKTSLSLSDKEDSDLASAFDQFVRQSIAGVEIADQTCRPLDARDRLTLAVGQRAPGTISNDLLDLLDKIRSVPDASRLADATTRLNDSEQKTLSVIRTLVQRSWSKQHSNATPSVEDELAILHSVYVLPFNFAPDGPSRVRAHDLLRSVVPDPDRSGDAWRALIEICRAFGPRRTGGDLEYFRKELERRGLALKAPRSFQADIDSLRTYTTSRIRYIERLAQLKLDDTSLKIKRPVVQALLDFATDDHCAVVGEPGAGKSGCLHDLVGVLSQKHDVVLLTADMVKASSPTELASDLRLAPPHGLVDVLAAWSGEATAFLVVDALDAARARMSLHVLCDILREVTERAPRWRIVASIREYDLRSSPEVQELFEGEPHEQYADPRFPDVRHLSIKSLTKDELDQLRPNAPRLAATFDAASASLSNLLLNPFNLSLLCKLLDQHVGQSELNAVQTQVDLLDLYWTRRAERTDDQATAAERRAVLAAAVGLMVADRELHVASSELDRLLLPAKGQHAVFSDGVLVHVSLPPSEGTESIGFAHNILFDYAVHRLWLDGMSDATIKRLSTPTNHDLLLALRPSIVMTFERLWYRSPDRKPFWDRCVALSSSREMHLVGKIIAPGVAAQEFKVTLDFEPLISQIDAPQSVLGDVLQFTVQAAVSQLEGDAARYPVVGPHAPDWMVLAERLCTRLDLHAWEVRSLLLAALRSNERLTEVQARHANAAAIACVRSGLAKGGNARLVRPALEMAIVTIAANPRQTVEAVRLVLTPEAISVGGHEWLHSVGENITLIAEYDEQLTLDFVDIAFTVSGSRDDQVPMGGRLLPMSMNKHDLLAMARHDLDKAFSRILQSNARLGTRMLIHVMTKAIEEENKRYLEPQSTFTFAFLGGEAIMRPDASHIWTAGDHNRHEDWFKVLTAFKRRLIELGEQGNAEELTTILLILRDECSRAIVWSAVLDSAAHSPSGLVQRVYELLASPSILGQIDTRKAAGDAIAKGFEFLDTAQRSAVEEAILQIPSETKEELKDYATHRRNRMLGCIPRDLIASPELQAIRDELDKAGGPPPNVPDFSISTSWGGDDQHWWLRHQGVKPEKVENRELIDLSKQLKESAKTNASKPLTVEFVAGQLPLLKAVEAAIERGRTTGAEQPLIDQVDAELIDACEHLAAAQGLKRTDEVASFIRKTLLAASASKRPEYDPKDDAQWDKGSAGWGSPSPRIDAAMGLMRLASSPDLFDDEIRQALELLAKDRVPAVRYQVLCHAGMLYRTAPALMWSGIEHCCLHEPRAGIVDHVCSNVLLRLPTTDFGRLRPLIDALSKRTRETETFDDVRRACAVFYTRASLWDGDEGASNFIADLSHRPFDRPDEANKVIDLCRGLLNIEENEQAPKRPTDVRKWAVEFLSTTVRSLRLQAEALHKKNAGKKWPEEDANQLRTIHILAHNVATEFHIGTGASRIDPSGEDDPRLPVTTAQERRVLLEECDSLFAELSDIPFVEAAYDVLQTLEFFIDAAPRKVLLWVASLVRRAEADGVQYESMAADLAVRIVERYLAEYGPLFRDDSDAREALLDVLGVFLKVGWPSATRLTHRLGEVFR
jgi:hypothetical protein